MADLVRELALTLDRPVMDRTGFTGEFDLNLNYTGDALAKSPEDPGGNRPPAEPKLSIVFAAMQKVELKLEPAKAPSKCWPSIMRRNPPPIEWVARSRAAVATRIEGAW